MLGLIGLAALVASLGGGIGGVHRADATTGPCNPVTSSPGPQAQQLLSAANGWRSTNLGQPAMQLSAVASKAAQWFAEDMIAGQAFGHNDQYGRTWVQRLQDCGFDAYWSQGSGEALAGFGSSDPTYGSTVDQAIQMMTADPLHGNAVNAPVAWQCAGVGYAANPTAGVGQDTFAWVVVAVQTGPGGYGSACDAPVLDPTATPTPTRTATSTSTTTGTTTTTATASASPSASVTQTTSPTATASPTPSATPSPTPSPTPEHYSAYAPMIARD
jgi:uncharacterized protein YkwD